ncbi:AEC family transporter [Cohnella sp. GCM10020058]|uniref:AEC family transporter n=1 Tax=Cohnella sp. GCM10020058 TaxID=3317330 RepID=UPI003627B12A
MPYFHTFANVSIPILIACCLGYLYQKYKAPDSRLLADLSLFALSPCLIVSALASSDLKTGTLGTVAIYTLLQTALCWAAAAAAGRLLRMSEPSKRALELTTIFSNSNNYGLPLLLLAFGTQGFAIGVTNVVTHVILVNTLGFYLAARASFKPKQAFRQIVKTPLVYAAAVGIALFLFKVRLPESLSSGLELVGGAYPAVVLLLLGMQLRKTDWRRSLRPEIWISLGMRILIVPLLSYAAIAMLGLHGLTAAVLFVQSSMPAAINSLVLMERYGGDKELVAMNVAFSTAASFLYLPLLVHLAASL